MVEVGPRGPARNTKHLANLGVGETFHVVHHNHRARSIRQLRERFSQPLLQFRMLRGIPEG